MADVNDTYSELVTGAANKPVVSSKTKRKQKDEDNTVYDKLKCLKELYREWAEAYKSFFSIFCFIFQTKYNLVIGLLNIDYFLNGSFACIFINIRLSFLTCQPLESKEQCVDIIDFYSLVNINKCIPTYRPLYLLILFWRHLR